MFLGFSGSILKRLDLYNTKRSIFFWKSSTDEVTISFHHHLLKASLEIEFIKRNKEEIFYRRYKSADI